MKFISVFFPLLFFLSNFFVSAETSDKSFRLVKSSILVLSQDDLFKKSKPGRALLEVFEEKQSKLLLEAEEIEQLFIAEEKNLTEQRSELTVDDFQVLADEFDIKVEKMRKSRAEKDRKLQKDFAIWRKKFVQIALPIIREQMSLFDALIVLDTNTRGLIYDKTVDVTDVIISSLNEEYLKNPGILEQVIQEN
ncbi:MAG: hypothetical protein CML40_01460 [Rhodobacteraceae bacterium]|nr:MAG: hypothetical protein CML40_01460 [Paracoccaceae bacterium]|tara:strand:+ start:699 stop:1277 length:579 start_codon:yes stop_codon:yes gene_type:complete